MSAIAAPRRPALAAPAIASKLEPDPEQKTAIRTNLAFKHPVQLGLELALAHGAHNALGLFAVLENDHRGDVHNAEAGGRVLVLVHVELGDLEPAPVRGGQLVQDGAHDPAGAAPLDRKSTRLNSTHNSI